MRLCVMLQVEQEVVIPLNYQYQLSSAIYHFLEAADADYAHFLHGEGYAPLTPSERADSHDATPDRRRF